MYLRDTKIQTILDNLYNILHIVVKWEWINEREKDRRNILKFENENLSPRKFFNILETKATRLTMSACLFWSCLYLICIWQTVSSHLSFQRGNGVLQFLSELRWHQTFDLLLVLLTHQGHLRRQRQSGQTVSVNSEGTPEQNIINSLKALDFVTFQRQ